MLVTRKNVAEKNSKEYEPPLCRMRSRSVPTADELRECGLDDGDSGRYLPVSDPKDTTKILLRWMGQIREFGRFLKF